MAGNLGASRKAMAAQENSWSRRQMGVGTTMGRTTRPNTASVSRWN